MDEERRAWLRSVIADDLRYQRAVIRLECLMNPHYRRERNHTTFLRTADSLVNQGICLLHIALAYQPETATVIFH